MILKVHLEVKMKEVVHQVTVNLIALPKWICYSVYLCCLDSSEAAEDDYVMSNDLWESDVTTDDLEATDVQEAISDTIAKCRSLIKIVKKSSILTAYVEKVKAAQKIRRNLSLDCKSRWNSSQLMIETFLKFKSVITQLQSDKHDLPISSKKKTKLTSIELSSNEWRLLSAIHEVLTPFLNATKLISGRHYATVGTCLFAIRKIEQYLETDIINKPFSNDLKELLLEKLREYINQDIEQHELLQVNLRLDCVL
jgi:hypothetical protein